MNGTLIQERYQLIEPIGEGGLGTVFYGWDHQLERGIAIKRLHSVSGYRDPQSEAYQEARVMAALQHPNIVTLYDFGIDDSGPYFIMEYLQGYTLADQIKAGCLDQEQFRCMAQQCLEGLAAAHEAGVIHRDIKPNNIMLLEARNAPFRVKILDFGMARVQQAPREQTAADDGSLMGSIYYMAPEQLSRHPVDARTDLYSLGHMLYHALAGRTAFEGETIMDLINAHLHDTPLPIRHYRPDLDKAIETWLNHLMQRDPALRPASAHDALDSLPGGTDSAPIELATTVAPAPATRPNFTLNQVAPAPKSGSGGWIWWALSGVAALVVGGLAFMLSGGGGDSGNNDSAVQTAVSSTTENQPSQAPPPPPTPPVTEVKRSESPVVNAAREDAPAPSSASPTLTLKPDDLLKLGANVGESVEIRGTPVEVSENRSRTIYYLNFSQDYREAISLVFFISDQPDVFTRERLEQYVGKSLAVRGTVERYRSTLQMKIRSLDQIEVL